MPCAFMGLRRDILESIPDGHSELLVRLHLNIEETFILAREIFMGWQKNGGSSREIVPLISYDRNFLIPLDRVGVPAESTQTGKIRALELAHKP